MDLSRNNIMELKNQVSNSLTTIRDQLIDVSHKIHAHPELGLKEVKACTWLTDLLNQAGFTVEKGLCGLPTAFSAKIGSGPLHIAFCAEYDALPEVGHACGHNIIAAASLGAGIALKSVVDKLGLTIHVIGTPGEEEGGGKIILVEGGAFDGIHAAMMVHPSPIDLLQPSIIALEAFDIEYTGKEAHASATPEYGINAADALTIAQVAIGLLRQHIHPTDRIHGIITKGGDAPNVIPAHTSAKYIIRSQTSRDAKELREKVLHCFEAGALATGAKLKIIQPEKPYAEMKHYLDILEKYKDNAEFLGRAFLDDLNTKKASSYPFKIKFFMYLLKKVGLSPKDVRVLLNRFSGSTDMGNISLVIPSIHPSIGIEAGSTSNHQPEFAALCVSPSADKAIMDGALAMAWTAVDIANDKKLRKRLIKNTFNPS